mmetsp:Transcript_3805/g.7300  ORF Transcript_3805/g.7300 Transcript_3805/m.7300 type:complete len:284 (-) Transcript_3805:257-1108(-)
MNQKFSSFASQPLCRFFVANRNCRYGDTCRYSHELKGMSQSQALKTIPCPFFLKGACLHGDSCRLKHEDGVLVMGEMNIPTTYTTQDNLEEGEEEATCGICLEDVRTQPGRQFGLLSCCNHVFCYSCVMNWRTEGSQEAQDRKVCPTCRKPSDYVVPSVKQASSTDEKEHILAAYKAKLASIPCKRFTGELGSCHFGKDCFYAHWDEDGNDTKPHDGSMQELYEQRRSNYHYRNSRRRRRAVDPAHELADMLLLLHMLRSRAQSSDEDHLALTLLNGMLDLDI